MNTTFPVPYYEKPHGFTAEAKSIRTNYDNALDTYIGNSIFYIIKYETNEYRHFLELKNKWKSDTKFISSGTYLISNQAYQEIISFGRKAVPWIIKDLQKTNDHWFFALAQITGENPIKNENIGNVEKMSEDWLEWASINNYV